MMGIHFFLYSFSHDKIVIDYDGMRPLRTTTQRKKKLVILLRIYNLICLKKFEMFARRKEKHHKEKKLK